MYANTARNLGKTGLTHLGSVYTPANYVRRGRFGSASGWSFAVQRQWRIVVEAGGSLTNENQGLVPDSTDERKQTKEDTVKKVWLVVALAALGGLASKTFADVQNIRLSGDIRIRGYFRSAPEQGTGYRSGPRPSTGQRVVYRPTNAGFGGSRLGRPRAGSGHPAGRRRMGPGQHGRLRIVGRRNRTVIEQPQRPKQDQPDAGEWALPKPMSNSMRYSTRRQHSSWAASTCNTVAG